MSLAIEAFVINVRDYCDWIESNEHNIRSVRQTILALMQGIPYLIANKDEESKSCNFPRRGYDDWAHDVARMKCLPLQYYRVAFDRLKIEEETAVIGDVCDDLVDIYGELWHGLQAHDAGATDYAIAHWRDSYRFHWGLHANGAICAIDAFLRTETDW